MYLQYLRFVGGVPLQEACRGLSLQRWATLVLHGYRIQVRMDNQERGRETGNGVV